MNVAKLAKKLVSVREKAKAKDRIDAVTHLFGIKYAPKLEEKVDEVIKKARKKARKKAIPDGVIDQINKGTRLAEYVDLNEKGRDIFCDKS